jgi:hypothetical protein
LFPPQDPRRPATIPGVRAKYAIRLPSCPDRPHRLVTTSAGSEPGGETLETRIEILFQAKDGKTLMTIVQQGFPTAAERDFFEGTAWVGFFDRLEAYFTAKAAG